MKTGILVICIVLFLTLASSFAEDNIRLFGIEGSVLVHVSTATNAEWTLKCISNNNERETVINGTGEKYVPLEELILEPFNPFENHEFVLSLSSTSSIPSFSLEIATDEYMYVLQEGFISSDSPDHTLVLIYRFERLEQY
jgi:hypothetical protein